MKKGYADYKYTTARRGGRRRKRRARRFLVLLLLIAAALTAYRATDGFSRVHLPSEAAKTNIQTNFTVDLGALAAQCDAAGGDYSLSSDDEAALEKVAQKNPEYKEKINFFIKHASAYSQTAVNTLLLAPEKADFVLLCPFAQETASGSWDVTVKKGEIPFFIQYDSRWAFHPYGSSVMGNTACGPTCLAMAAAGLTGSSRYTPDYVSDYAEQNGYYVEGTGTSWELFTSGAAGLGVTGRQASTDKSDMERCLKDGGVLIASMAPGDFTMAGHFIVIYGYGIGEFRVYDPSSVARSGETWSYARLEPQIAQLWCLTAG